MNCTNCGADVTGRNFCPQCGSPVTQAPVNAIPVQGTQRLGNPTQVLVFGILGLALGLGTGVVGLIFSILAITKANNYIATYGDVANQVRIGKRLGIAGLIVSIVMMVLWIVVIAVIAANWSEFVRAMEEGNISVSKRGGEYNIYLGNFNL